jgi:hypothetical protein
MVAIISESARRASPEGFVNRSPAIQGCAPPALRSRSGGRLALRDQALIEPRRPLVPRRNEGGMSHDPGLSFKRPELGVLLDIWRSKRQGRPMPARADLSPFYRGRLLETIVEVNSWVVRERAPLRIFSRTGHHRNEIYNYDGVLLPLSADGETVNMVLGALLFTMDRNAEPSDA